MTLEDIKTYFGPAYQLHKKTGMSRACYKNWQMKGYIPILTQMKIQELTGGELRADYAHGEGKDA